MHRATGVLNLVQAGVFAFGVTWLAPRSPMGAALAGLCAGAQVVEGAALLAAARGRVARAASLVTLVGVAGIVGLFLHAGVHLQEHFGPDAARTGKAVMAGTVAALPWVAAFPLWQVLAGRRPDRATGVGAAAVLLALLMPPLVAGVTAGPDQSWADPGAALEPAAAAAFGAWTGAGAADVPETSGPATVLLTPWSDGTPGEAVRGDGADLGAAVADAVKKLPPPGRGRAALVLDVAVARWDAGLVPIGGGGLLTEAGGRSPTTLWRPGRVTRIAIAPEWSVPQPKGRKGHPTRFASAVADGDGAHRMAAGWVAPPELTAAAAREAALNGARHILANMQPDGAFTYTVLGPSGKKGTGYNYTRHAGTAWYLARVAERTGDAQVRAGAVAAVEWMVARSEPRTGAGTFVTDPRRKDGRAWVGTTALAALAANTVQHPVAADWGAFVASTVADDGQVHGEVVVKTGANPDQQRNPYGQGQSLLALAALVRSGHEDLRPALVRAADHVDGSYSTASAVELAGLDEHWSCLAALAARDAIGRPAGMQLCRAYLANREAPSPAGGHWPAAGAAGGGAEAVVAGAFLDPTAPWSRDALDFGRLFLANQFQGGDAPFLKLPGRLVGGFRDRPWDLDVRIDAVQHIGCAMLGIEALLAGEVFPGSLP